MGRGKGAVLEGSGFVTWFLLSSLYMLDTRVLRGVTCFDDLLLIYLRYFDFQGGVAYSNQFWVIPWGSELG